MEEMLVYKAYFVGRLKKVYIGITNQFSVRKSQHMRFALKENSQVKFHRAIRKHGTQNLRFSILEYCFTIEQLVLREQFYIKKFDSFRHGYNMTLGGEGSFGSPRPKSEHWKKQHSKRMLGKNNPRYGHKFTGQEKNNQSIRMKIYYKEHPEKILRGEKNGMFGKKNWRKC